MSLWGKQIFLCPFWTEWTFCSPLCAYCCELWLWLAKSHPCFWAFLYAYQKMTKGLGKKQDKWYSKDSIGHWKHWNIFAYLFTTIPDFFKVEKEEKICLPLLCYYILIVLSSVHSLTHTVYYFIYLILLYYLITWLS